jgi:hypothetical protein
LFLKENIIKDKNKRAVLNELLPVMWSAWRDCIERK